jgi:hypothetical protein
MLSRSNLQGSTFKAQHGFIMEYYLIVISIACVKRKIIKLKYPVACSRSVGAAGERDLLIMEYDLGAGDSSFPGSWPQFNNCKAVSRRCCVGGCKSLPLLIIRDCLESS